MPFSLRLLNSISPETQTFFKKLLKNLGIDKPDGSSLTNEDINILIENSPQAGVVKNRLATDIAKELGSKSQIQSVVNKPQSLESWLIEQLVKLIRDANKNKSVANDNPFEPRPQNPSNPADLQRSHDELSAQNKQLDTEADKIQQTLYSKQDDIAGRSEQDSANLSTSIEQINQQLNPEKQIQLNPIQINKFPEFLKDYKEANDAAERAQLLDKFANEGKDIFAEDYEQGKYQLGDFSEQLPEFIENEELQTQVREILQKRKQDEEDSNQTTDDFFDNRAERYDNDEKMEKIDEEINAQEPNSATEKQANNAPSKNEQEWIKTGYEIVMTRKQGAAAEAEEAEEAQRSQTLSMSMGAGVG